MKLNLTAATVAAILAATAVASPVPTSEKRDAEVWKIPIHHHPCSGITDRSSLAGWHRET